MLELTPPVDPPPFDAQLADERSDAELDALGFGVIALDADGTILRYNLYESRFARLDRNQVIGRNFFVDVAYCVRNEAFEGRFRALVASGDRGRVERFPFFFDFKFGAQEVMVEMLAVSTAPRFYLFINRLRIHPPRSSASVEQVAASQSDLAPDEAAHGVLRDDHARRFVDAPAPLFAAFRATCDRLAPETWQIFASEWGVQWGRRAVVDLDASALEKRGLSLRELPMREVARLVCAYFADRGWGSPAFDFAAVAEGLLVVDVERSALAEAAPRRQRGAELEPDLACHLMAGCLTGILSAVADRRLAAREVACVAAGAGRCSMVVVGHARRGTVDACLAEGVRGVEPIREALRRAPRSVEGGR